MINFWKIYEIVKDAIRKDRIHRDRMLLRYIKSFKKGELKLSCIRIKIDEQVNIRLVKNAFEEYIKS
jgi:hypothetical protein